MLHVPFNMKCYYSLICGLPISKRYIVTLSFSHMIVNITQCSLMRASTDRNDSALLSVIQISCRGHDSGPRFLRKALILSDSDT